MIYLKLNAGGNLQDDLLEGLEGAFGRGCLTGPTQHGCMQVSKPLVVALRALGQPVSGILRHAGRSRQLIKAGTAHIDCLEV